MVLGDLIRHAAMFVLGLLAFFRGASGAETDLNSALQQALEGRGHLGKLLEHVPERTIQTTESATRLVSLLEKTSLEDLLVEVGGVSQLDVVITLFQETQDAAAIGILTRQGLPHLYRLSNELQPRLSKSSEREFLFLLQVFAGYKTRAGSLRVLRAAREGVLEDHPLWPYVFDPFLFDHNDAVRLLQELTKELPQGQIGRGVLDCANALLAEGGEFQHPFDQDRGVDRLASWLNGSGDDDVSEIQSAVAALPFLKHAKRAELLEVAFHHPHPLVKAEAGWLLNALATHEEEICFFGSQKTSDIVGSRDAISKNLGKASRFRKKCSPLHFWLGLISASSFLIRPKMGGPLIRLRSLTLVRSSGHRRVARKMSG